MPSLFDQFTGTCSVTTLKKLPSDDSYLKSPTKKVKMIYGGLILLFTLFKFISKTFEKIKKCAPALLCSRPEQKKKIVDAPLSSKEKLVKLRTLLSMYNPEHYSSQILSTYKDVWIQKIEDAYYAYNCSLVHLNEKEEEELVHDDVLRFVVKTLNKASSSVNLSTSTIAANVSDVSTSENTSTTEDAAEPEVNPDDSNESSKCTETIAESNPKVIEEVVPQSQVQSKASSTKPTFSDKQCEAILAKIKWSAEAISSHWVSAASHPENGVEELNDVAQAHPHPEVVPSPVLFHRDRGRSDEFILDLPGCSSSQIQSEAILKEPDHKDPTREVATQTDVTEAPADMSSMMEKLSSYPPCPKKTASNLQEGYDWIVNFESFLHKLNNSIPSDPSWKDLKVEQYHQLVHAIFRTDSRSRMLDSRKFRGFSTDPFNKVRSINQLEDQIIQKLKNRAVPIHSKDPVEEKDARNQDFPQSKMDPARLRSSRRTSSRCRRKDSRSW